MVIKTDMTDRLNYARNQDAAEQHVQHNADDRMTAVEKTSLVYRKIWQWLAYTEHPLYAENVNVNSISTHQRTIMIYIITFICLCIPAWTMYHVRAGSGKLDYKMSFKNEEQMIWDMDLHNIYTDYNIERCPSLVCIFNTIKCKVAWESAKWHERHTKHK